jgi:hypothetical protein
MPVARIYASLVEEAEPICADLLARGYNVEVVFPDAILPVPADLELRVERCSAEQAIARVQSGAASPSRCVFVTRGKGPRQELLLVEMTVLATGTDGRHPVRMPVNASAATGAVSIPLEPSKESEVNPVMAAVLPFPVVSQKRRRTDTAQPQASTQAPDAPVTVSEQAALARRENEENLGKNVIAELNAFLANAPLVEPEESLPEKIFDDLRRSRGFARVRKNWEPLTLLGIAISFVVLVSVGWYAAPTRPRHAANATSATVFAPAVAPTATSINTPTFATPTLAAPPVTGPLMSVAMRPDPKSAPIAARMPVRMPPARMPRTGPVRRSPYSPKHHWHSSSKPLFRDNLIARDSIARANSSLVNRPPTRPPVRAAIGPAPIKKITDLK